MFCREHVAQLREHQAEIEARGANLAAIGMGDFHYARAFREDISFPLLIDVERAAYRAVELKSANLLHLLRRDNAIARKRANAAGHRQHKLGENPFQLGASFVFGPGNVDCFTHMSETFGDNASVSDVLSALSR